MCIHVLPKLQMIPDQYKPCVYRMLEFYKKAEIREYVHTIDDVGLDAVVAVEYLDRQTRTDYDGTENPHINDYLLDYIFLMAKKN